MNEGLRRLRNSKFVRDTVALQVGKLAATALASASFVVTLRLLGPQEYGVFGLAQGLLTLLATFDLTGIGIGLATRLGLAVGQRDPEAVRQAMAVYVRVSAVVTLLIAAALWAFGAPLAAALYGSGGRIGQLAAWLALASPADALYALLIAALLARRQMGAYAALQAANQAVLSVCVIGALLVSPSAEAVIAGRIVYSYATLAMACVVYGRLRAAGDFPFPPLSAVLRDAPRAPVGPSLGFGFASAVDKNLAAIMLQLPQQWVGAVAGERAAGLLISAINGTSHLSLLTSAIFDNMQAVVPQRVGQRDYAGLWRIFGRVIGALVLLGAAVYGGLALFAPLALPRLLGQSWQQAVPVFAALAVYGVAITVGSVFGPLYRALDRVWWAVLCKAAALGLALAAGAAFWSGLPTPDGAAMMLQAALVGAWMINIAHISAVGLVAGLMLPRLRAEAGRLASQKLGTA